MTFFIAIDAQELWGTKVPHVTFNISGMRKELETKYLGERGVQDIILERSPKSPKVWFAWKVFPETPARDTWEDAMYDNPDFIIHEIDLQE